MFELTGIREFNPPYDLEYYMDHRETFLTEVIHWIGCRLGIILQGDETEETLKRKLDRGSIVALVRDKTPIDEKILSIAAQKLITTAYEGLEGGVFDGHFHVLGKDEGNYVPPQTTWANWAVDKFIHFFAGITSDVSGSTDKARKWLYLHANHFYGLHGVVLPIHPFIKHDGRVDWKESHSFLSNYSADITVKNFKSDHSKLFAAVSIHPNDPLWNKKLEEAAKKGKKLVKWFPSQGIMPNDPSYIPFFQKMGELEMTLIVHTGPEHAVETVAGFADAGNPLMLRTALNYVNVIFAHSGHFEWMDDLDHPGQKTLGFELFKRVATEENRKGKAFGEMSALLREGKPEVVQQVMAASKVIDFIHASDFPYPLARSRGAYQRLADAKILKQADVQPLKEIQQLNPLLAHFVLARTLQLPDGYKFPLACFSAKELLPKLMISPS